nr:integrase, catalytic region, zinc finger, CCHC-type, peptidase aspartic, catalytic [Tanacetum cinerariifolium]
MLWILCLLRGKGLWIRNPSVASNVHVDKTSVPSHESPIVQAVDINLRQHPMVELLVRVIWTNQKLIITFVPWWLISYLMVLTSLFLVKLLKRSSFARCLIEVNSEADLIDVITMVSLHLLGMPSPKKPSVLSMNVGRPGGIYTNDGFQMEGKKKKRKGKSKSINGGQFAGPSVKQTVRYEPKTTISAPKKGATNMGDASKSSYMLKTTSTSSKNDNHHIICIIYKQMIICGSSFAYHVFVFKQGDDPINSINKMMSFLSTIVISRFPYTKFLCCWYFRNKSYYFGNRRELYRDKVLLVEAQGNGKVLNEEELEFLANPSIAKGLVTQSVITHNAAYQADDLDAYDFDCDGISTAKAALMANLYSHGSDVLSENEITSDSNIIPYSQYLLETQNTAVQDTNSFTQQDAMILSVFEQLSHQIRPMLYDGSVIAKKTNVISVADSEETLMLEEENRSKMLLYKMPPKCHNNIKNDLRKLKGKEIVDNAAQVSNATIIAPGMYKLDLVTLARKDKNNRETHICYLKHTMEQAAILRKIVEQAYLLNPLDSASYSACKYAKLIQEFLGYIRDNCPNIHKPSEKLVVVTPINKMKTVRITATNKVPLREPIPLKVAVQESVVTRVHTRRPKGSDTLAASSSSSLIDCSLELVLHEMTPVTPNSRLISNPPPLAPFIPPSRHEWDLVFQPVFVDFFSPLAGVASTVPVEEALAAVESTSSPSSTTVDQDAPSPSTSQTTPQSQSQTIILCAEEESHDLEVAHMSNDPYFSIPIPETVFEESSSSDVIPTIVHSDAPILEHLIEPKTYKDALTQSCWIKAMQEELNEFERLKVWELVPRPDKVMVIILKWIYNVKLDELGGILKNKARLALCRERFKFLIDKLGMRSFTPETLNELADEAEENINPIATQQAAIDNALFPPEKRLKIKRCNARVAFNKPQREETYQEDFMYQADNKEISSARKEHMPYPRFTKVIINHFISKDKTISMRNMIKLHTIRDESLLDTLKFVSKTQDYQQYGAMIPDDMINEDIKDFKAYKTYNDFATGKVPPRKVRKYKKVASPLRKLSPIKEAEPVIKAKKLRYMPRSLLLRQQQQNGVVERRNQTLIKAVRTMLIYAQAPLFLWAEAGQPHVLHRIDPLYVFAMERLRMSSCS